MFQPPDVLRKSRYNGCGFVQVELDSLPVSKALSEMLFSVKRGIWNLPICKLSRKKTNQTTVLASNNLGFLRKAPKREK